MMSFNDALRLRFREIGLSDEEWHAENPGEWVAPCRCGCRQSQHADDGSCDNPQCACLTATGYCRAFEPSPGMARKRKRERGTFY